MITIYLLETTMALSLLAIGLVMASTDAGLANVTVLQAPTQITFAALSAEDDEGEPEEESDDTGEFEETNEADAEEAAAAEDEDEEEPKDEDESELDTE